MIDYNTYINENYEKDYIIFNNKHEVIDVTDKNKVRWDDIAIIYKMSDFKSMYKAHTMYMYFKVFQV